MAAWLWLAFAIVGSSGGNVLMKYASQQVGKGFDVYLSLPFIFGAALFGGGLVCYMRAIETIPLALAYPTVVGTSIVVITAMAILLFGERVNTEHVIGVLLIFSGLYLLTRNGIGS